MLHSINLHQFANFNKYYMPRSWLLGLNAILNKWHTKYGDHIK